MLLIYAIQGYGKQPIREEGATSTFQEYEYVEEQFGYPKDYVQLLGLPRFDNLNNNNLKKDQILVMPTWRNWIAREVECMKYEGTKVFIETGDRKSTRLNSSHAT